MKKFDKIFKIQKIEKISLFIRFWGGPLMIIFFSILLYSISIFDPESGKVYLFFSSIVLILITGYIEFPLISRDKHIQFKKISTFLSIILINLSFLIIFYLDNLINIYGSNKYIIPLISLFLIPQLNELFKKIIEFRPLDVKIKFHEKSKMSLPGTGIKRDYWHDVTEELKGKGLPVFISNNSKHPIIITNFRLEVLNAPPLVPKIALRRVCKLDKEKYSNIYVYYEFALEDMITIQPNHGELYIINMNHFISFNNTIKSKGELYSRIMQPMYITAIDSFNLREYPSEKTYYPMVNLMFVL